MDNNHLYRIERSNAHDVYLKDMENSAVAGRVIPLPSYSETLAKNPLNDFLKLDADHTQKDSRSIYKECLYTLLEKVERSEIYPLLRDRDTTEEEAENLIREKIEDLFASGEVENAVYSEAIDTWAHFGEWIQEDIFQRTYQDVITDRRDAVALYQDSMDAPQWVRGIMVPYAAEEKTVEPALQPLPLDAANEYNTLKERYPDALVGYEQYGNFEFYGEDAKRVSELLGSKLLEKETALGKVEVSGFPHEQWVSQAMKLWKQGESVYLSGQQEDGTHVQTKYFRREEYLPVNTIIELDDREFRVDSVDFGNGTVSLQDMTLAKEARYPVFRTEPLEYIRHLYEQADVPMEEAVEITVFTALHNAGVAYEDFSPEQMDVIYSVAESGGELEDLLNPEFPPEQMQLIADVQNRTDAISRAAAEEALEPLIQQPMTLAEVNHARRQHNLPLDSGAIELPAQPKQEPMNFRITDDDLGAGGPKTKYKANVEAIQVLQTLDAEQRQATAEEQEILSRYVGWGGIPQAFDESNAEWSKEYAELQSLLTADEYKEARASTLNAFYTSPTVIKAMYEALGNMGLSKGNVLEPSCGVGNFMGLVPDSMEKIRMYGVELDSISGRIAQQLYKKNKIAVQGFETMQFPDSFFDCVVGNVPFGNYKVPDKRYDRHNFLIHDYFIAKSLDLVRPGGVVAVVTSSGTMDKKDSSVREYLANRADLVGAIRLPNNAFQRNANTSVVADILFLQKRDRAAVERADWVDLGETPEGYSINQYFAQHPEMVLGEITTESTQYGKQETTVKPIEGADLAQQLKEAVGNIHATITEPEISDDELDVQEESIPADPSVKNFSFTNVDGQIYYRENSFMNKVELPAVTAERVLGMIALRETTRKLLDCQLHDGSDAEVQLLQNELKQQYTAFKAQYGLINSTANKRAFRQDSSYCLLASLEILDEERNLKRLADIFTKRTIRKPEPVTSVDTPSEALALSIGEKAKVDAFKVWEESSADKGTQLIFCDLSTPKADGTFNVYDDVREKLVARGVPREEVAFIHEYNTETKKADLFAKVRAGQVRILMGSTPKLGAGTNIQDRLIALHHLDCPWKPSDLEQQEGRILRQGNRNKQVKIYRYVTENTFDSYMWQILENKQKFISQIMTSKSPVRACDDVDDTALSYAEIKALATGNPYIKEKMDLDIQVSKLKLLKANHTSQIYSLESDIARRYPREIAVAQGQIEALKTDMEAAKPLLAQDKDHFSMEISGKVYTERKEAGAAIIEACKALKAAGTEGRIGSYGAFELHSRFDNFDKVFRLSIKGAWNYSMEVGKDPQGNILRVTNALSGIERALPQVERRLETLEQQLAQAKEEAKRPFVQEAELAEKSARLAELNSLLNMDEKGGEDALGVDEDAAETEVADRPRQPVNYAGRVAERTADNVRKPSVLAQLHAKQAERSAEPQKSQKRKSHDMEL